MGLSPDCVKPKTIKLVFVSSSLSAQHKEERARNMAQNQDNVSEWGDMSIRALLFQLASTIKNPTKHAGLVQSRPHHRLIEN